MGLKDIWHRWSKGEDRRALERSDEEGHMSHLERDIADEDFESRRDDVSAFNRIGGQAAIDAAGEDVDTHLP
jgi:hypothetical protein